MEQQQMFYENQKAEQKELYKEALQTVGSLSNLSSSNTVPFLNYRVAENVFCKSFDADDRTRADVSVDAVKGSVGLGLKTFLHGNGKSFQKVAEFNSMSSSLKDLSALAMVQKVCEARNYRIKATQDIYGLVDMHYHCVTRLESKFLLFEEPLVMVDCDSIANVVVKDTTILFNDAHHEYSFSTSKSTLNKRFVCDESMALDEIPIDMLYDPLSFLMNTLPTKTKLSKLVPNILKGSSDEISAEHIYLPLYAPSSSTLSPALSSGLNQWNAGGRERDQDEIYIPIPSLIHQKCPTFFPQKDEHFDLELPNGKTLSAKVCQSGGKALMSNPNKALGQWLLRDVLKAPYGTVITRELLDMLGIDSVVVSKSIRDDGKVSYKIDFAKVKKFEDFKNKISQKNA